MSDPCSQRVRRAGSRAAGTRRPLLALVGGLLLVGCGGSDGGDLTGPRLDAGDGILRITTSTRFPALAPEGFLVRVGAHDPRAIGVADTLEIADVSPGNRMVELSGLTTGCDVDGTNPRSVDVRAGEATDVRFRVVCTLRGRLLYSSEWEGARPDIFAVDGDLEPPPVRLTETSATDLHPTVSPDGRRIAFECRPEGSADICVADADGGDVVNLTRSPAFESEPAWSPDGTRIAFTSTVDGEARIWVMNADGSDPVPVTRGPGESGGPVWAPDGERIAFHSDRHDPGGGDSDIYVVEDDGLDPVRLTRGPGIDAHPAWSPDGTRIAFMSDRAARYLDVWVMDADGGNPVNLTGVPPGNLTVEPSDDLEPAWSPDGTRIAFVSERTGTREVWVMAADGSDARQVTREPSALWSGNPVFGP